MSASRSSRGARGKVSRASAGDDVRVWWPPTDDEDRTDFAGAYWPVKVLKVLATGYKIRYDNGECENVKEEHVHPSDPPVEFGAEQIPLQVGEYVEVYNGSISDPCAWLGQVKKALSHETYMITYPFHDCKDETVKMDLLRRARIWEHETAQWKILKPKQIWEDGEVTSPVELETITPRELARHLSESFPDAVRQESVGRAKTKPSNKRRSGANGNASQNGAVKKRKGQPQRLR